MKTLTALPLTELGYLHIEGVDAETFLQGQLSSDLRKLTPELAQISSYNTAKGRVLALPHLMRTCDGGILLELPRPLLDSTLARLRMFVLRAKVKLQLPDLHAIGIWGSDATHWLRAAGLTPPEAALACTHNPDIGLSVLRRLGTDTARYSVTGSAESLQTLRQQVPADAWGTDFSRWRLLDIEAAVPTVLPETRELFIPQMLNLDLLGGIGFDKGCYTGQEIVARLHFLGQVKRRMFVTTVTGHCPAPGAAIVTDSGQAAGEIVDAMLDEQGECRATSVIQLSQRQSNLQLKEGGGRIMVVSGPES